MSDRYYLSAQDLRDQQEQVEEEMRGDRGCGASYTLDGPPCGTCIDCRLAQVSYYFYLEREQATRFQQAGFEVADPRRVVITVPFNTERHDWYAHYCAGEVTP